MSKVRLLPSISRTQVKAHVHRQNLAHVGLFPRTQSLKNRSTYARIELHTHECKLRMQAQAHACKNTNRSSSSTFSKKHHPKSILDMFLPNPIAKPKHLHGQKHIKTEDQRETWKWEKEKEKTYKFTHGNVILWPVCQWWDNERKMRKSERMSESWSKEKNEEREVFVKKKKVREMERMKKEKKKVGNRWRKWKGGNIPDS